MAKRIWDAEKEWIDATEKDLYATGAWFRKTKMMELMKGIDFRGKRVLDYGCGTGIIGKAIKEMGADVVGIDISERLLETAAKRISVKWADGTELPFENGEFDYVVSSMVLMAIEDLEGAISEIRRVLKSGGRLLLSIVHPHSEKWDPKTGMAVVDESGYHRKEKRFWVFNLRDGRRFETEYFHRPLECYFDILSRWFTIDRLVEPQAPEELLRDDKHARREYLFIEAVKK